MSEPDAPHKMRLIAVGAALIAMVFTLVAVIVVLTRDGGQAPSAKHELAPLSDHEVSATDVVRLSRKDIELVTESGVAKGVRVTDPVLAKSLGLADGDVISAISGKLMTREQDSYDAILKLSLMDATTMYVEVTRNGKPTLLRWRVDGDLRQARYGVRSNLFGATPPSFSPPSYAPPSASTQPLPPSLAADPDPLLDTIVKIDDTHYQVPRKTFDAFLANPMSMTKGARVVPAMRNGQPEGFKLYAIRPSSGYAKIGFANGDTIHAVNGFELTSADKALELYTKVKDATTLSFDITRRGRPIELVIEITK